MMLKKLFISFFILLSTSAGFSQSSTINPDVKEEKKIEFENNKNTTVLLIPFEHKMFLSEIDKSINKETGMNFNQIRGAFRYNLDISLLLQFKSSYNTYSLMTDTAKTAADLSYIYESIGYRYDPVPQALPVKQVVKKNNRSKALKEEGKSQIKNGQLVVEENNDKSFMNTVIKNPNLISHLRKKYPADIFVFINELDIKNDLTSPDISIEGYPREVTVHYTIFDKNSKQLDAGIATTHFVASLNDPKKISNECFSKISKSIFSSISLMPAKSPVSLTVPKEKTKK